MSRSRDFALTVNNPDLHYFDDKFDAGRMRSIAGQLERGEHGTLHYQACVSYKGTTRLSAVRAAFPGAHVTVRRRTREELFAYCTKEETREPGAEPISFGEPFCSGGQGHRSDLQSAVATLRSDGIGALAEAAPTTFVRYSRGFFALDFEFQRAAARVDRPMRVAVLYGSAGSGKTRAAYEVCRFVASMSDSDVIRFTLLFLLHTGNDYTASTAAVLIPSGGMAIVKKKSSSSTITTVGSDGLPSSAYSTDIL